MACMGILVPCLAALLVSPEASARWVAFKSVLGSSVGGCAVLVDECAPDTPILDDYGFAPGDTVTAIGFELVDCDVPDDCCHASEAVSTVLYAFGPVDLGCGVYRDQYDVCPYVDFGSHIVHVASHAASEGDTVHVVVWPIDVCVATVCTPDPVYEVYSIAPCDSLTPVLDASWGAVKSRFRTNEP